MLDKNTYYLKKFKTQFMQLVLKLGKAEERSITSLSTGSDLSVTEMHTLVVIGRGHPKTMSDIAADLMINVSTLSIAIRKLESRNYVRKIRNEADRRVIRIALTTKGRHALDEHEQFYFDIIAELIEPMKEDEKKKFIRTLTELDRHLDERFRDEQQ